MPTNKRNGENQPIIAQKFVFWTDLNAARTF